MFIPGTPVRIHDALVNVQPPNNPAIQGIMPARMPVDPAMGILGTLLGVQDAHTVDIPGAAPLFMEDPGFEYLGMR